MTLFKETYRIESPRWRGKNYTDNGMYFVTICTHENMRVFGETHHGMICLSKAGSVIAEEWQQTEHLRYYVTLDRWIIMPNHIHAIISIQHDEHIDMNVSMMRVAYMKRMGILPVETRRRRVSMHTHWKSHSLGAIVNQFKTTCTKRIRVLGQRNFAWQSGFYDHVIRNEESLLRIRDYIHRNPERWEQGKDNLDVIGIVERETLRKRYDRMPRVL
ncbi:MAG: hypothetical protein PHH13_04735 [Candidatus Peribacteraceae bacterium]|nr:hypothetical protein [Candidatus Peribacteraceae bacterium]